MEKKHNLHVSINKHCESFKKGDGLGAWRF